MEMNCEFGTECIRVEDIETDPEVASGNPAVTGRRDCQGWRDRWTVSHVTVPSKVV
jgi:hypothetical protein